MNNQTAEEPKLLSPLACCLIFLVSGVFISFAWNVLLDSMGIREKGEENLQDFSFHPVF